MQLICTHDPADPNHLICETKPSPVYDWLRRRWQEFYCSGPTCPPHKAYTHLIVDVLLGFAVLTLLAANALFMISGRRVQETAATLEERIAELEALSLPQPSTLTPALSQRERGIEGDSLSQGERGIEGDSLSQGEREVVSPLEFSLRAEALYFSSSGEQLGRGPWPPVAGEPTKLKIVFNPEVSFEDFRNVEISGELGQYVSWTSFAPLGRGLSYEPATRLVRWVLPDISDRSDLSAVFEVEVILPQRTLEEQAVVVMKNVRMRAEELVSGVKREIVVPDVLVPAD